MQDTLDNVILFVMCVNDDELYTSCMDHILNLDIPKSYKVELFPIHDAKSMAKGYNQAITHRAKYKIYLHQDVFIQNPQFLTKTIDIFKKNEEIGFIGMIGCEQLPQSGIWWDTPTITGKVIDYVQNEKRHLNFQKNHVASKGFVLAEAVDGLLIATQYDLPWNEELFDGFHFYDISQCLEFKKAGYLGAVPIQDNYWCVHSSMNHQINSDVYEKYRQIFLTNYINPN